MFEYFGNVFVGEDDDYVEPVGMTEAAADNAERNRYFDMIDRNKDGVITKDEFSSMVAGGFLPNEQAMPAGRAYIPELSALALEAQSEPQPAELGPTIAESLPPMVNPFGSTTVQQVEPATAAQAGSLMMLLPNQQVGMAQSMPIAPPPFMQSQPVNTLIMQSQAPVNTSIMQSQAPVNTLIPPPSMMAPPPLMTQAEPTTIIQGPMVYGAPPPMPMQASMQALPVPLAQSQAPSAVGGSISVEEFVRMYPESERERALAVAKSVLGISGDPPPVSQMAGPQQNITVQGPPASAAFQPPNTNPFVSAYVPTPPATVTFPPPQGDLFGQFDRDGDGRITRDEFIQSMSAGRFQQGATPAPVTTNPFASVQIAPQPQNTQMQSVMAPTVFASSQIAPLTAYASPSLPQVNAALLNGRTHASASLMESSFASTNRLTNATSNGSTQGDLFSQIDKNGNGTISREEFDSFMQSRM